MGLPLAFAKANRGSKVVWIGNSFVISNVLVGVSIKQERLEDLLQVTKDLLEINVIPRKAVRSFAGKCASIASVIEAWRPFLTDLWAAIAECDARHKAPGTDKSNNAPKNCIWQKQIRVTLFWVKAFLTCSAGTLARIYRMESFFVTYPRVRMLLDASPWGLGGLLVLDEIPCGWFANPLGELDVKKFGVDLGTADGQQIWESLCLLVAIRLWKSLWYLQRLALEVRSDNLAALFLLSKLKSKSPTLNLIGRELAFEFGNCSFKPKFQAHTPGVANVIPDLLSRKFQPGVPFQLPPCLRSVQEFFPPARDSSYYLASVPPMVTLTPRKAGAVNVKGGVIEGSSVD